MDQKTFNSHKKALKKQLDAFKLQIDKKYTEYVKQFISASSDIERNKVYELDKSRKRLKRFVVYSLDIQNFDGISIIIASGWWLDEVNVPAKWDSLTVGGGVSNPNVLKLSKNQTHLPHPGAS